MTKKKEKLEKGLVKHKDGSFSVTEERYKDLADKSYDSSRGKGTFVKDQEALLKQYRPLIGSMIRWYGTERNFKTDRDRKEFKIDVEQIFLELVNEYDPFCGIDFAGYIKNMLKTRIERAYVFKHIRDSNRSAPLRNGDYTVSDMLDGQHENGDNIYITNKKGSVVSSLEVQEIDTDFQERLDDINRLVDMDKLDKIIFIAFQQGFSSYITITDFVDKATDKEFTHTDIHNHVDSLRDKLSVYYEGLTLNEYQNKQKLEKYNKRNKK